MKKIVWIYIRFVQKILIAIFLTLTYIIVFPLTWLFYVLFTKNKLKKAFKPFETYWLAQKPLSDKLEDFEHQS